MTSHLPFFVFITSTIFPTCHSLNAFPPAPFLLPEKELNFKSFHNHAPHFEGSGRSHKPIEKKVVPTERLQHVRRMLDFGEPSTQPMRGWIWKNMQTYKRNQPLPLVRLEFPLKERVINGYPQSKPVISYGQITLLPEERDSKRLLDFAKMIYTRTRNKKARKDTDVPEDFIQFMKKYMEDDKPDWKPPIDYHHDNLVYSSHHSFRGVTDGRRGVDCYFKDAVMPKVPELWDSQYHV